MFDAMRDPELMRMAQEEMSRMSPADFARMQQKMMSNPELIRMVTEDFQKMRAEDIKLAAEQLKHTPPEQMAEISEKMTNVSPEELASMRSRMDAQISYEINAAEMLKKQGNELHNKGMYKSALEKYARAKTNLKDVSSSRGRNLLLVCALNMMSCYLKTDQFEECIKEGNEALAYDPSNLKALYRRGQAYKELGKLEDAVSDLKKAVEISPSDETVAEMLRDVEERLAKQGGIRGSRGLIIEEISDESMASSEIQTNSTSEHSENLDSPKDEKGSSASETLPPDMLKTASSVIEKMSPEDLRRMAEVASSSDPGSHIPTGMLKTATEMMSKMSPEDLQKMFQMASSLKGGNQAPSTSSLPANVSPDMIKMANDVMSKMSAEDRQQMFEFASSSLRPDGGSAARSVRDHSTESNFPTASPVDLQEQMRNQMKDPATRQMLTSMMKNMNPDAMANMSEQLGFKLSREEAEKAQQAMSNLSPEALDTVMRWADRIQRCVEAGRKTKNWLLGKQGMVLAIFMLLLALMLHWFGFIGK